MRKWILTMMTALLLTAVCGSALASGVTLRVFTPFADEDIAAQAYMDAVTAWENETGNLVEDYSGTQDEMWLDQLRIMLDEDEVDVIVVPVGVPIDGNQVVTAQELAGALDAGVGRVFTSMKESDGSTLLVPVRLSWEALYVNEDVLEANGLAVPTTYEELLTVCAALAQKGVTPISNELGEWPVIALDCAALAGAEQAQYGMRSSLEGAAEVMSALAAVGAFGQDAWSVSDEEAEQRFLSGDAAMRFDGYWLAEDVPQARQDCVSVMNLPAKDGQARTAVVGTPCFGVTLTRACWEDDARCEAALSLVGSLLTGETAMKLTTSAGGRLGESIAALTGSAEDCTGVLYDLNPDTYDAWLAQVSSALMGIQ